MTKSKKLKNSKIELKKNNQKSKALTIAEMKIYFRRMSLDDFKDQLTKLMKSEDVDQLHFFFYYIILFRDLKNIQDYLNDESVPIEVLEKLFMFTYGHCTIHGYSTENILDNILSFVSNERLMKLLQESDYIKKDKFFRFFVLARFDIENLNVYFNKEENIIEIISAFYRLPEDIMKTIIVKNHKLFEYMMMILLSDKKLNNEAKLFIQKYKKIIDQFSAMNDIIMRYHTKVDLAKEEKLPFDERNMKRISFLVKTIRTMSDKEMAMEYFAEEHVFADDYERQIIVALVSDPLLKGAFQNINKR